MPKPKPPSSSSTALPSTDISAPKELIRRTFVDPQAYAESRGASTAKIAPSVPEIQSHFSQLRLPVDWDYRKPVQCHFAVIDNDDIIVDEMVAEWEDNDLHLDIVDEQLIPKDRSVGLPDTVTTKHLGQWRDQLNVVYHKTLTNMPDSHPNFDSVSERQ